MRRPLFRVATPFVVVAAAVSATPLSRSTAGTTITSDRSTLATTYDYIIAGGGLTGLVVANKLSGAGHTVLVIEAGPNSQNVTAINDAAGHNEITPAECDWRYTAYAENGTALPVTIQAGRCLGGSSSINGEVFFHPSQPEIDALESAFGSTGWNWAQLFPRMLAAENVHNPTAKQAAKYATDDPSTRGTRGLVNSSFPTPLRIPGAVELYREGFPATFKGLQYRNDLNDRGPNGQSTLSNTMWTLWYDAADGKNYRSSAADAYLYAPTEQRPTLTVLVDNLVTRVVFNKSLHATGVKFGDSSNNVTGTGKEYTVSARREVLLAAGTLATPAILERSGIGGKAILHQFGITQLVDLPGVGLNAQDQPGTGLSGLMAAKVASNHSFVDNVGIFAPIIALVNGPELFGSEWKSKASTLKASIPDRARADVAAGVQANLAGATAVYTAMTDLITNSLIPVAETLGETYPGVFANIFWPLVPFSRGSIHISSAQPFARPRIVPRYLTDDFDVDVAVAVAKKGRALFESSTFHGYVTNASVDAVPDGSTDEQWADWFKSTSYGASHWLGSCSMLPRKWGGVVDNQLRVYGTTGLRVIDVSVHPIPFTSHTMPVAYSTALLAADILLGES